MKAFFVGKHQETPTVYSFTFKPELPFQFVAGQFLQIVVLVQNPDNRGARRSFTICSSPADKNITITTRVLDKHSTFKKSLLELKEADPVEIFGPFGKFILPSEDRPVMFITGGVGITPARSMIVSATNLKRQIPLRLLYSNVTPEEIIFYDQFSEIEKENKCFKVVYTISQPGKLSQKWSGRIGRIDTKLIRENVKDFEKTIFYVSGPPSLVIDYSNLLQEMGTSDEQVKRETFPGY